MSEPRSYTLRYAKAQEFYGYESVSDVLVAVAAFDNENGKKTYQVNLNFNTDDATHGATVLWEDV